MVASPLSNNSPGSPTPSPKPAAPKLTAKQQAQQAEKQAEYLARKERENALASKFLQLYMGKLRELRYFERCLLRLLCCPFCHRLIVLAAWFL